jgi:hypothetical protein
MKDLRRPFWVRTLRATAAIATALVVASCSAIRFGYDHADTLLVSSLDRYLDLTGDQELFVRERARELLAWHRATQLRGYASLIESARAKLDGQLKASDVLGFNEEVNGRFVALGDRAAPDLAQLALTLKPEQIERLDRRMSDETARVRREFASADAERSLHRRTRRFIEQAEAWFGDLRADQVELVRASFRARQIAADWSIQERMRRQALLVAMLRQVQALHPDASTVAGWLREYFAQLADPTGQEAGAHARQFRLDNAALIAQLINSADREQRARISQRLTGYAEDLSALAAEGGGG